LLLSLSFFLFSLKPTSTPEIYTLSLHDALPIFDRLEPTLARFSFVFGIAAFVKQAAVHARVQSFHAPFEHFGKGGETGNLAHREDRKSTRLNSSHGSISYAVFCLKKKKKNTSHN